MKFTEKLNKKLDGSIYVIEETVLLSNGVYENLLEHDNINPKSIRVYTGSRLTGEKLKHYLLSVPSDAPWKTYIKLFAEQEKVYITYETDGDTVEADDVNLLQEAAEEIRNDFEVYQQSGHIDGGSF